MADFDVNTITVQGAIAIASATAGDKLVIDGCDATTDVLTQAQAVQIATRPASPASTTDTIGLAGSTDNHVYAYASFIRGESTGGDVHSFLLYGHMESDVTTVFVVAVASATAATHIPTSGDVTNRVEIQFELTFSATDEVVTVTDTSMYTTRGEFLILKNRTVTTHAEGQATVGENQTVYGSKDFKDAVDFNGIYTVQASRTEAQGGTDNTNTMYFSPKENLGEGPEFVAITKDNGTAITGSSASMFAGSLNMLSGGAGFTAEDNRDNTPTASMEASRGLSGASAGVDVSPTQVTLYTQAASGGARRTLSYTGGQLTGSFYTISTSDSELNVYVRASAADIDMYFDATTPDSTWSVGLTNVNDDKTATLKFYAGADSGGQLTCEPATGGISKLGTEDTPWNEAHIGAVQFDSLEQVDGSVFIDGGGVYTNVLNQKDNDSITVYGHLVPSANTLFDLGSNSSTVHRYWKTAYIADVICDRLYLPNIELTYDNDNDGLSINTSIFPSDDSALDLGSINSEWNDIHCAGVASLSSIETSTIAKRGGTGNIELQSSIVPQANTSFNLGNSGNRFGEIWAQNLNGRLPNARNPTGYLTIGAIAFVCVDYGNASSSQINFNNEFWKNNGGILAIYPAMFNPDYPNSGSIFVFDSADPYLDSYKFIALCSTYGSGRYRFLFAMLNQM